MTGEALTRLRRALTDHGYSVRGDAAQCPAHDDEHKSLSIGQGHAGALVKCHAGDGCTTDAILEALGMSAADLFDEPRTAGNGSGSYQVTATYTYTDEHGRALFCAERRQPKDFRQYRMVRGEKVWGLGDARRVLYRLPNVLEALQRGEAVWVAEGEKDVHALEAAGVTATCNPMGAGKWRPEYAAALTGATVVIVADKDDPGRAHAAQVAASLTGKAASVRVVEAAEGKDATDHLAAGHSLGEFITTPDPAAAALRYHADLEKNRLKARQLAEAELLAEASRPAPPPVRLDHLLAEPDEQLSYRVDRLWPAGGRVILAAQRKAGKTTTVANLLRCLADGEPFLGRYAVTAPAGSIFTIDTEMSRRLLRTWLAAQKIRAPERVHIECLRGAVSSFNILDPVRRAEWAKAARSCGAEILVLDCIGPVLAGLGLDENSALDTGRFLAALEELLTDAAISEAVIVHHMGHLAERSRGASRLRDWPDAEWRVLYEKSDDGGDSEPGDRRYFAASGRDVAEPEQLLDYDRASRRLTVAGGSRRDEKAAALLAAVIAYISTHAEPECSQSKITEGVEGRAADVRAVLTAAAGPDGSLCVHDGKRGAKLHRLRSACPEHSATPSHPVQGVLTDDPGPPRPTPIRVDGGPGGPQAGDTP